LNIDRIFSKFTLPWGNDGKVKLEDLETGLNHMSYPMLRLIAKKSRKGVNMRGEAVYD